MYMKIHICLSVLLSFGSNLKKLAADGGEGPTLRTHAEAYPGQNLGPSGYPVLNQELVEDFLQLIRF